MKYKRNPIRVLITGKSPMECRMLLDTALRFRRQFTVVATAGSKKGIFHCLASEKVDVVLLSADLQDERLAGLKMLLNLRASYPAIQIIMLLDPSQNSAAVQAFWGGARGVFCRSETNLDMLRESIDAVYKGKAWANSRQLQVLLKALHSSAPNQAFAAPKKNRLTKRAQDIANFIVEGLQIHEVAQRLGISEHTVSNDLFTIYEKLGFSRTASDPRQDSRRPKNRALQDCERFRSGEGTKLQQATTTGGLQTIQ